MNRLQRNYRKRIFIAVKVILGVSLLLLLFSRVDFREFVVTIKDARTSYCLLGFTAVIFMGLAESLRLVIALQTFAVSFSTAVFLYLSGLFFSNFMPGNVGAEIYKVYFLSRIEHSYSKPVALMLLLRFSGLLVILLTILFYIPFNHDKLQKLTSLLQIDPYTTNEHIGPLLTFLLILFLVFSLLVIFLNKGELLERIISKFRRFFQALFSMTAKQYLGVLLMSGVIHGFRVLSFYFFLRAFATELPFFDLVPMSALVVFASLLPISFASLGVREGAIVGGLMFFDISAEVALAVAALSRFILILISLAGGCVYISIRSKYDSPGK